MVNPALLTMSGVLSLVATGMVFALHFGISTVFRWWAPVLYGVAFGIFLVGVGLRRPVALVVAPAILTAFLIGIAYYDWWGLGSSF